MTLFFDAFDPAQRERIVAIDWKSEHWRDNARGQVFAELDRERERAAGERHRPYYMRVLPGAPVPAHLAPYAVRPHWNPEKRALDLGFVSSRSYAAEGSEVPETVSIELPESLYALALTHHRESVLAALKAQFAGTAPGGVIRARHVGGEAIRDYLREHSIEVSDSFACDLFAAIAKLDALN